MQGFLVNNSPVEISLSTNYIQNSSQKAVLASETMRELEIFSQDESESQQFTSGKSFVTYSNQNSSTICLNNNIEIYAKFIHNISTNLNSEISIRAP